MCAAVLCKSSTLLNLGYYNIRYIYSYNVTNAKQLSQQQLAGVIDSRLRTVVKSIINHQSPMDTHLLYSTVSASDR